MASSQSSYESHERRVAAFEALDAPSPSPRAILEALGIDPSPEQCLQYLRDNNITLREQDHRALNKPNRKLHRLRYIQTMWIMYAIWRTGNADDTTPRRLRRAEAMTPAFRRELFEVAEEFGYTGGGLGRSDSDIDLEISDSEDERERVRQMESQEVRDEEQSHV